MTCTDLWAILLVLVNLLYDNESLAFMLTDVVDGADVGMFSDDAALASLWNRSSAWRFWANF